MSDVNGSLQVESSKSVRWTGKVPDWALAVGVFILALLPRVINLAAIITPDERRWAERSVGFFTALLQQDWAHTFQTGHPGVTTMWTGTMGLWGKYLIESQPGSILDFLGEIPTRPSVTPEYLAALRLPTAILSALAILLVYLLLRRLFETGPALIAAVLLALDPFYIAHSRVIHHDALATTFTVIALLTFLGFVWRHQHVLWLVASGAAAGLAFLSKGSALFLLPFVGLVLLCAIWADVRQQPAAWRAAVWGRLGAGLLWAAIVALVFIAFWPAMWVHPGGTVLGMLEQAVGFAEEAHSKGNFFLGQPVADPGLLFYPLILLLRTTPVSLIGLILFVVELIRYARRHGLAALVDSPGGQVQVSLLAYLVLFTAFMGLGAKKFDRYLLPVFPIVDILAGIGIAQVIRQIAERNQWGIRAMRLAVAAVILMQCVASLPQHPYYLSAYNALAGGPWLAPRLVLVGWGEGLEQAADYLNSQPDAENLQAATFYYRDIATYFKGKGAKLVDDDFDNPVPWQGSEYVVFYINQLQRLIPDEATVRYFQTQPALHAVERNGIPYAQVYRTPATVPDALLPGAHVQRVAIDPTLEHVGYTVEPGRAKGDPLLIRVYWRTLGEVPVDYQARLELVDRDGKIWGTADAPLLWERRPTSGWPANRIFHTALTMPLAHEPPAGGYSLYATLGPSGAALVRPQPGESPREGAVGLVLGPFQLEAPK